MRTKHLSLDVVIIGSGAAGLSVSLQLADYMRIALISKANLNESATLYAQDGISAVLDDTDNVDSHVDDTLDYPHTTELSENTVLQRS